MAYTKPTIPEFRMRYPSFDLVDDACIQMWIDEGDTETPKFSDTTRARAVMALAAHRLAERGFGNGVIPAGVTSFKSGTFNASVSEMQANRTGFHATVFGREYLDFARRDFAGPRLAWTPDA